MSSQRFYHSSQRYRLLGLKGLQLLNILVSCKQFFFSHCNYDSLIYCLSEILFHYKRTPIVPSTLYVTMVSSVTHISSSNSVPPYKGHFTPPNVFNKTLLIRLHVFSYCSHRGQALIEPSTTRLQERLNKRHNPTETRFNTKNVGNHYRGQKSVCTYS